MMKRIQNWKDEFLLLMSYFPNLKTIDVSESGKFSHYMTYLRDINLNEYLTRIENIKCYRLGSHSVHDESFETLYVSACYNIRQTLTQLVLCHVNYTYIFGDKSDTGLGFLLQFENLNYLDYYNDADKNLTVFDVHEICRNLNHLKFGSAYTVPDDIVESRSKLMGKEAKGVNLSTTFDFNKNIQVLELQLPALTTPYIRYITDFLPRNMDKLHIKMTGILFYKWLKKVGWKNALQLARRLSTMNNARIECPPGRNYERTTNTESKMTRFFKLLGALKNSRKLYCYANFADINRNEVSMSVANNRSIEFRFGTDDFGDHVSNTDDEDGDNNSDNEDSDTDSDDEHPLLPFEMPLPDINTTVIGPEIINNFKLTILRAEPEFPYQLLKYALTSCSHLGLFELDYLYTYRTICISPNVDNFDRFVGKCDPTRTAQENLKKVKLVGVSLSNDVLNLISTYLPDLEVLLYLESKYCNHYDIIEINNSSKGDDGLLNCGLTGFRSLNTFHLDIQTIIYGKEFGHIFICFKYAGSEGNYYDIQPNPVWTIGQDDKFISSMTTLDYIEECYSSGRLRSWFASFQCNNQIKEILISSEQIYEIAYIGDGQQQTIADDYYTDLFE